MPNAETLWRDLELIRTRSPLVHNITNFVVMNSTANALLSLGASPVMAHAPEEIPEVVAIAGALVINIGTLSGPWIESMKTAVREAAAQKVPWVLDPVGAGATRLRTRTALDLIGLAEDSPPAVIRGNASEIMALHGAATATKGVDSTHSSEAAMDSAQTLAWSCRCTICVSGQVDMVTDGSSTVRIANGHELMPRVTGLGCTATAITGAFLAVNSNGLEAAAHAMGVMGIAGEMAAEKAAGPGTLQLHFLDILSGLNEGDIRRRLKMECT